MNTPTQLVRSEYHASSGGCVSCAVDLASVKVLTGVHKVDVLASGVVLVTHDGTVADTAIVKAARQSGLDLQAYGPARPVRTWPWSRPRQQASTAAGSPGEH